MKNTKRRPLTDKGIARIEEELRTEPWMRDWAVTGRKPDPRNRKYRPQRSRYVVGFDAPEPSLSFRIEKRASSVMSAIRAVLSGAVRSLVAAMSSKPKNPASQLPRKLPAPRRPISVRSIGAVLPALGLDDAEAAVDDSWPLGGSGSRHAWQGLDTGLSPDGGVFDSDGLGVNAHDADGSDHVCNHLSELNPATGLPMVGGMDVGGNPYGFDNSTLFDHSSHNHFESHHSLFEDRQDHFASHHDQFGSSRGWPD